MNQVVIPQKIYDEAVSMLAQAGFEVNYPAADAPLALADLKTAVSEAHAILPLLTDKISAEVMDAAPKLRVIANVAVGYDNIDVSAATERGIIVTNTPDVLTETTADLAFALLLAIARRIPEADAYMRAGKYKGFELFAEMIGIDVYGKTLGIVGMGRIGTAVALKEILAIYTQVTPTIDDTSDDLPEATFRVQLPLPDRTPLEDQIRQIIDAYKPAFTTYELVFTGDQAA